MRKLLIPALGLVLVAAVATLVWLNADRDAPPALSAENLTQDMDWFFHEFTAHAYDCDRALAQNGTFGWVSEACGFVEAHYARATDIMDRVSSEMAEFTGNRERLGSEQYLALLDAHNRYQHARLILGDFTRRVQNLVR